MYQVLSHISHLPYFAMYNMHFFAQIFDGKIRDEHYIWAVLTHGSPLCVAKYSGLHSSPVCVCLTFPSSFPQSPWGKCHLLTSSWRPLQKVLLQKAGLSHLPFSQPEAATVLSIQGTSRMPHLYPAKRSSHSPKNWKGTISKDKDKWEAVCDQAPSPPTHFKLPSLTR